MNWIRRVSSVEWMLLILWIIGFACYTVVQPLTDPDTPWHIGSGLYILSHHVVPTTDPFSWTMKGSPWVTQEWLWEVCLAWMVKHFAFIGAWLYLSVIHALTVVVLYRLGTRASDGNRVIGALTAGVGTLLALPFWILRPQIVSYLFFALFLYLLQCVREERQWVLLLVPPVLLVWANSHGSATIGLAMLVFELLVSFVPSIGRFRGLSHGWATRGRLLCAAVIGAAAGLLNPNGLKAYTYALLSGNSDMTNNIMEWHSPDFHTQYFQFGVLPAICAAFLILLAVWDEIPLVETLYFVGTFALTLIHQRFMPYCAIALVPLLSNVFQRFGESLLEPSRVMRGINVIFIAAAATLLVRQAPHAEGPLQAHMSKSAYPIDAVNYLKKHPEPGHLLNSYEFGGYLIYEGIPTFIDGRTDVYLKSGLFDDYLNLRNMYWNAPNLLDKYDIQTVLCPPGFPLMTYLTHSSAWQVVYQDRTAEIAVRVKTKS